ncbi:hypothetical protein L593_08975 [Salinarchaeum sp. Harcht-Bsk1]|uniref:hypothetical protein n=1 Tax=Salinarchaeum sp. Harcht-Bsk1 TaxID=1333523 RepID=UPI0003424230|nr:hypothetical protein [Salinarchaeum sp. Harcht-Bsk1]AGN01740.1 hypothetical protein L593_08975 [Salinarchaeum sp. Harcht-Bsk1]
MEVSPSVADRTPYRRDGSRHWSLGATVAIAAGLEPGVVVGASGLRREVAATTRVDLVRALAKRGDLAAERAFVGGVEGYEVLADPRESLADTGQRVSPRRRRLGS